MNSLEVHEALNDLGYKLPESKKKEPAYAFEHKIADGVFLYVKKKEDGIFDENYLLIHPSHSKNRESLESIEDIKISWIPRKNTSYREFPKFEGDKSPYGYEVTVKDLNALTALIDAISPSHPNQTSTKKAKPEHKMDSNFPLNQIIYGPPGTGKTYSTTAEAVKLAEPAWYEETKTNASDEQEFRKLVKARYDTLVNQGRIAFTTFHQSFSYEDFVEGIRALTDEDKGTISYEVVDGIFKQLCTSASVDVQNDTNQSVNLNGRKVWKMSLGDTMGNEEHIYDECSENDYVLLGWGQDIDFTGCSNRQEVKEKLEEHLDTEVERNNYELTSVNQFKNDIKIGDIIIVSDGNHKFRAIAEVTGDYEFLAKKQGKFRKYRRHKNFMDSQKKHELPRVSKIRR